MKRPILDSKVAIRRASLHFFLEELEGQGSLTPVSEKTGVSKAALWTWIGRGYILQNGLDILSKVYNINPDDLETWGKPAFLEIFGNKKRAKS